MSVEIAIHPEHVKVARRGAMQRRIVALLVGVIVSLIVGATVWALSAVLPSKMDSPFAPIRALCEWIYGTSLSTGIRESTLAFPVIEGIHLLGIALSVGMLCWFDLRLIGVAMCNQPVSKVWRRVMPAAIAGFILMFITGGLLFWAESVTAYNSVDFWIKMGLLVLACVNAGVFELTTHRHAAEWDSARILPMRARLAGLFSLILWVAIIVTGRTMAYSF